MRYQKIHVCTGEKPTNKNTLETESMEFYNYFNLIVFTSNLLPQPKGLVEPIVTIVVGNLVGFMLASVQFRNYYCSITTVQTMSKF